MSRPRRWRVFAVIEVPDPPVPPMMTGSRRTDRDYPQADKRRRLNGSTSSSEVGPRAKAESRLQYRIEPYQSQDVTGPPHKWNGYSPADIGPAGRGQQTPRPCGAHLDRSPTRNGGYQHRSIARGQGTPQDVLMVQSSVLVSRLGTNRLTVRAQWLAGRRPTQSRQESRSSGVGIETGPKVQGDGGRIGPGCLPLLVDRAEQR